MDDTAGDCSCGVIDHRFVLTWGIFFKTLTNLLFLLMFSFNALSSLKIAQD